MRSMTGFGQGSAEGRRFRVSVTLRAVNHRYLDLVIRLKDDFRPVEKRLRDLLTGRLTRGRVEAIFEVESLEAGAGTLTVNEPLLDSLRAQVDSLAERGRLSPEIRLSDLLRVPDGVRVVAEQDAEPWSTEELDLLPQAAEQALEQLVAAREAEGQALHQAIGERLTALGELHSAMATLAAELPEQLAEQLRERIARLVDEESMPDATRLAQEVALMVDRTDVSEELDRLRSHLEHFLDISGHEGSIGKRLDFLSQEVFRELNTIGSKCRDAELVRRVLDGKVLCEQVREQVQNVE